MQVIVHIGDAKCGSSSIQASLFKEKRNLRDQGILYHPPSIKNGHYSYVSLLGGRTRGNNQMLRKIAKDNVAETREIIGAGGFDYLILSAESLFFTEPSRIFELVHDIAGEDAGIHIIAFVRHPVDFYLSITQQILKANHEFIQPENFIRDVYPPLVAWKNTLIESLTLRLFDRKFLSDGSVISEFSRMLRDITTNESIFLSAESRNISFSAEQLIVLQNFRRDFLAQERGKFSPASNRIITLFNEMNSLNGRSFGTKLSLRDAVKACVFEINEGVILKLDKAFPALGMMESCRVPNVAWRDFRDDWQGNVSSIISSHDPALVLALRNLISAYNPDRSREDMEHAFKLADMGDIDCAVKDTLWQRLQVLTPPDQTCS